mmetsp:Transcript_34629/g.98119  ORF Transcript_34629/g.98119 Transcript_34629/m.98119 type:complete len:307 (-) Transcript_34629:1915-2835(-)
MPHPTPPLAACSPDSHGPRHRSVPCHMYSHVIAGERMARTASVSRLPLHIRRAHGLLLPILLPPVAPVYHHSPGRGQNHHGVGPVVEVCFRDAGDALGAGEVVCIVPNATFSSKHEGIAVKNHTVRAGQAHPHLVAFEVGAWVEVEDKHKLSTLAHNHLLLVILLRHAQVAVCDKVVAVVQLVHCRVKVVQLHVQQVRGVDKVPLPPAVLIAPAVTVAGEVNPLGVPKLVAHEVEPPIPAEREGEETDHLVEGQAAGDHRGLLHQGAHSCVHLGVHQAEGHCLVSDQGLVVALAVCNDFLCEAAVA